MLSKVLLEWYILDIDFISINYLSLAFNLIVQRSFGFSLA